MDGHAVSPLDLSRTLLVGSGLLVRYSLSGSPVIKQLMQIVNMVPGQGGRFRSVCFPNNLMFSFYGCSSVFGFCESIVCLYVVTLFFKYVNCFL